MGNELVEKKKEGISSYLGKEAIRANIAGVIGESNVNRFVSDIVACVQNNNSLAECTNASILSGALVAKSIDLPLTPQLGYAYLVPFNNKKQVVDAQGHKGTEWQKEAQFQLGYKGYIQLALKSGQYKRLVATDVRKGEISEYDPFSNEYVKQSIPFEKRTAKDSNGEWIVPVVGYYAMFEMNNGFKQELYISKEDMLKHADKYSKAYRSDKEKGWSNSFWTSDFDAMAKKTMLRQLLGKWGLLTPELQKAYTCDMAVIDENGNPEYVDNQPDDMRETDDPVGDIIDTQCVETPLDIPIPECFK